MTPNKSPPVFIPSHFAAIHRSFNMFSNKLSPRVSFWDFTLCACALADHEPQYFDESLRAKLWHQRSIPFAKSGCNKNHSFQSDRHFVASLKSSLPSRQFILCLCQSYKIPLIPTRVSQPLLGIWEIRWPKLGDTVLYNWATSLVCPIFQPFANLLSPQTQIMKHSGPRLFHFWILKKTMVQRWRW